MTEKEIIERIKVAQVEKGLSNYKLAQLTGLSNPTIARIMSDFTINLKTLMLLCDVLDLKVTID